MDGCDLQLTQHSVSFAKENMNETFETIKNLSLTAQTIALQAIDKGKTHTLSSISVSKEKIKGKKEEKKEFKIKVLSARFSLSVSDEEVK